MQMNLLVNLTQVTKEEALTAIKVEIAILEKQITEVERVVDLIFTYVAATCYIALVVLVLVFCIVLTLWYLAAVLKKLPGEAATAFENKRRRI